MIVVGQLQVRGNWRVPFQWYSCGHGLREWDMYPHKFDRCMWQLWRGFLGPWFLRHNFYQVLIWFDWKEFVVVVWFGNVFFWIFCTPLGYDWKYHIYCIFSFFQRYPQRVQALVNWYWLKKIALLLSLLFEVYCAITILAVVQVVYWLLLTFFSGFGWFFCWFWAPIFSWIPFSNTLVGATVSMRKLFESHDLAISLWTCRVLVYRV